MEARNYNPLSLPHRPALCPLTIGRLLRLRSEVRGYSRLNLATLALATLASAALSLAGPIGMMSFGTPPVVAFPSLALATFSFATFALAAFALAALALLAPIGLTLFINLCVLVLHLYAPSLLT